MLLDVAGQGGSNKQEGGVYGIHLDQGDRVPFVREQSSGHKYEHVAMEDICCTHYQHPPMNQKGRPYHFSLSLTPGWAERRFCHFPMCLRPGSLTWPCLYQIIRIHSGLHALPASPTPYAHPWPCEAGSQTHPWTDNMSQNVRSISFPITPLIIMSCAFQSKGRKKNPGGCEEGGGCEWEKAWQLWAVLTPLGAKADMRCESPALVTLTQSRKSRMSCVLMSSLTPVFYTQP